MYLEVLFWAAAAALCAGSVRNGHERVVQGEEARREPWVPPMVAVPDVSPPPRSRSERGAEPTTAPRTRWSARRTLPGGGDGHP